MAGQSFRPRRLVPLMGFLILIGQSCAFGLLAEVGTTAGDEPVLLGPLTREEIEAAMPDWVVAEVTAEPDVEAAEALMTALAGAEVTVFLGTWCSDSGRELPRLWRAMDELGVQSPDQIRYIGVNRDKTEPAEWVTGRELRLIPTFVVSRGGVESGRIVESSPDGIERDLLALLQDSKTGLVTSSEELGAAREEP